MEFEIIYESYAASPPEKISQFVTSERGIEFVRVFARERAVASDALVRAVLPLPTEQQQQDVADAIALQLLWSAAECVAPFDDVAQVERREIQQSVQDDLFFADERISTAFFMGLDTLFVLFDQEG